MKDAIDSILVSIAILYFVIGICLGIGMGMVEDFSDAHIHAHINLLGFLVHGFVGFTHRLWPGLREAAFSNAQFYTLVIGSPVFLIGLPLAQFHAQPILAILGSLIVLASMVMFLVMFIGKAKQQASRLAR